MPNTGIKTIKSGGFSLSFICECGYAITNEQNRINYTLRLHRRFCTKSGSTNPMDVCYKSDNISDGGIGRSKHGNPIKNDLTLFTYDGQQIKK